MWYDKNTGWGYKLHLKMKNRTNEIQIPEDEGAKINGKEGTKCFGIK